MSIENVRRIYDQATSREIAEGMEYYWRSRVIIAQRCDLGFSADVCCGVFAALSPNNDEAGNYRDLDTLLAAACDRVQYESFNVSTWGPNKLKAWMIARYGVAPLKAFRREESQELLSESVEPG